MMAKELYTWVGLHDPKPRGYSGRRPFWCLAKPMPNRVQLTKRQFLAYLRAKHNWSRI